MDTVERAAQLIIEHTRTRIEDCHCGWGVNAGALGQSHALHVAQALADAGLLAGREQVATLRQCIIDAMVKHFEDQRGHPPEQMQIEDLTDYADAVLRVLAEHGDTQQVREQVVDALFYASDERITFESDPSLLELTISVMAVVTEILAARDAWRELYKAADAKRDVWMTRAERAEADLAAAVERAEEAEGYRELAADECDKAINDVSVLSADLAAARVQVRVRDARLDQVRALHSPEEGQHPDFCGHDKHELPCPTLRALDAPRPATPEVPR
jgi:hypothetical protein